MKKLAIVTYSKEAAAIYSATFNKLLKGYVAVREYCVFDASVRECVEADLVIISAFDIYGLMKKLVPASVPIVIANLTFLKSSIQQIRDLVPGTRALVVNTNLHMALQCVEQIYQFGVKHIELIPYSPYLENVGDIDIAITPGEERSVPSSVSRIINTGQRVIDISTIAYVLSKFEMEELFCTEEVKGYLRKLVPLNFNHGMNRTRSALSLEVPESTSCRSGIISFASNGTIFYFNHMVEKVLGSDIEAKIGSDIFDLFQQPSIREAIKYSKPMQKKQIKINDVDVIVKIAFGTAAATPNCYLTMERAHESAVKIPSMKGQVIGRGNIAKYRLEDIIARNELVMKLKAIAAMNADSDSSVLITGESGTGKELFAQGIHNASGRKVNPFIAINCAAVPENLIESELFGYEEGAFTGARRGGKIGLFELAHWGTLPLDEKGEMPVHLQA